MEMTGDIQLTRVVLYTVFIQLFASGTIAAGPLCLACDDVISPRTCTTVRQCGEYDKCFVESVINTFGSLRYNLGCKDSNMCPRGRRRRSSGIHICVECCDGYMCNNAGCGFDGSVPPNERGPMCFACQYQKKIDSCDKFTQCGRGRVCILKQEILPTGEKLYHSGCEQQEVCLSEYNAFTHSNHLGRRNTDISVHSGSDCQIECCDTDYCNRKCNVTSSDPIKSTVTKSPTTKPPVASTRHPINPNTCIERWTPWINRNGPYGDGDSEAVMENERTLFCPRGGKLTDVECVTTYGVPAADTGEIVHCSLETGVVCDNKENVPLPCSDYKIRYLCACSSV